MQMPETPMQMQQGANPMYNMPQSNPGMPNMPGGQGMMSPRQLQQMQAMQQMQARSLC